MPTPSPQAQAVIDECLRQGAAVAATQEAPCGTYSSSILRSLGLTFQGLVMVLSLTFAAVTLVANTGASKSQFLARMRSRMNLPFFLGATIAYGSLIFIYQGPHAVTVILAYWMREIGFSVHYGAIFLKILSELRHRPLLRLERISAVSASTAGATGNNNALIFENAVNHQRQTTAASAPPSNSNRNANSKQATNAPSETSTNLPSTQVATHQAWLRASNKLNQTRLNKSSVINFVYILLVPVVTLSVWSATFASLPFTAARRVLCFAHPWSYVIEGFELIFIALNFVLSVRVVYKGGGQSQRPGPLFEIKLFKLLAVLLVNELMFSSVFYAIRHAVAINASSDMMALAHLLRDNLTITLNLMAVFIFKVAIRGGQMGSRTNLSCKSVTLNKAPPSRVSAVSNNTGARPLSVLSGTALSAQASHNDDEENVALLAINSRVGGDVDEATEAAHCIEIAELKRELRRVQMQAEYYRVKAMRKDNPHLNNSGGCTVLGGGGAGAATKKPTESSSNNNTATKQALPTRPATGSNRESALKNSLKLPSSSSHR